MWRSVRPAISMPRRSSASPKRSCTARFKAPSPPPPEVIRVESISQRRRRFDILERDDNGEDRKAQMIYRGRIAPSPTGYLHLGHAITFRRAQERCREARGQLVLRIEDLDADRCRPEFRDAVIDDLHWFGVHWDDGPYVQSERRALYVDAFERLRAAGAIYPCTCS